MKLVTKPTCAAAAALFIALIPMGIAGAEQCERHADESERTLRNLGEALAAIEATRQPFRDTAPPSPPTPASRVYFPEDWNREGPEADELRMNNNCYSYANGAYIEGLDRAWTPGMLGGYPQYEVPPPPEGGEAVLIKPENITCGNITKRALADGLESASSATACSGGWKVALVVRHKDDFHWVRQDLSGTWSGKVGRFGVSNTDSSDDPKPVRNPATADFGPYQFCNYFCRGQKFAQRLREYSERRPEARAPN